MATRLLPLAQGAHVREGGSEFALWTSRARNCSVRLRGAGPRSERTLPLEARGDGLFALHVPGIGHGARYEFLLDGQAVRDPYAYFLPDGVNAPAMVWRSSYAWKHEPAPRALREHVIYELHVGTFTAEGTYAAAAQKLRALAELGISAIELMPVAAFPGKRGWGYDGVAHYAPFEPYGDPDQLRAFIDQAHGLGVSVLLDVVYNHFGPAGNVLRSYGEEYFTARHQTAWGDAPNFEHPAMRQYVLDNVRYWLEDFRFDGLRFDAVHAIADDSPKHILREIAEYAASLTPKPILIAEDDRNDPQIVERQGFDAVWADDFHHQVRVAVSGERDGYYSAYTGQAGALADTIEHGWFYRGALYPLSQEPRGKDARALPAEAFVYCIENHDQIGNRAVGDRLETQIPAEALESATILLLFLPMTPMIFMGQEWGAKAPFLFFTDHDPELGKLITEGRRKEFAHFAAFADEAQRARIPDPQSASTFERSKLDWTQQDPRLLGLYRQLLKLRASDPVLRSSGRPELRAYADADVLIVERRLDRDVRRLIFNLGAPRTPPAIECLHAEARVLIASGVGAEPDAPLATHASRLIAYRRAD